jgi:Flp pilus assembly protein TadD
MHALKESGSSAEAGNAYRTATADEPADADAHLQLGHALKLQGKRAVAVAAYRRAWTLDQSSLDATRELAAFGWTEQRLPRLGWRQTTRQWFGFAGHA